MTGERPPGKAQYEAMIGSRLTEGTIVHENLRQQILITTEDRLWRCLKEHLSALEDRRQWWTPAGILATLVAVFVSADFHDFGLPKDTWRAAFILSAAASAVWLVVAVMKAFKSSTVEEIIAMVKSDAFTDMPKSDSA